MKKLKRMIMKYDATYVTVVMLGSIGALMLFLNVTSSVYSNYKSLPSVKYGKEAVTVVITNKNIKDVEEAYEVPASARYEYFCGYDILKSSNKCGYGLNVNAVDTEYKIIQKASLELTSYDQDGNIVKVLDEYISLEEYDTYIEGDTYYHFD